MSDIALLQDFRRVLATGIDSLVDVSTASFGAPQAVNQWVINGEGRAALIAYGIPIESDPRNLQLHGDVQDSTEPEVSISGTRGYRLGYHWKRTVATMTPSGEVWAIRPQAEPKRLSGTDVFGVNSSVASFVDISWRWHRIRPLLKQLGYRDALYEAIEMFLATLPNIDEALADEERYSWWRGLILGW